ncbi:hypothetical protein BC829DRAFT_386017 [Chytridium lagenaria]|nr:hypothetical protein BC829DRAFT_386017 [Chytridium lagenaria]
MAEDKLEEALIAAVKTLLLLGNYATSAEDLVKIIARYKQCPSLPKLAAEGLTVHIEKHLEVCASEKRRPLLDKLVNDGTIRYQLCLPGIPCPPDAFSFDSWVLPRLPDLLAKSNDRYEDPELVTRTAQDDEVNQPLKHYKKRKGKKLRYCDSLDAVLQQSQERKKPKILKETKELKESRIQRKPKSTPMESIVFDPLDHLASLAQQLPYAPLPHGPSKVSAIAPAVESFEHDCIAESPAKITKKSREAKERKESSCRTVVGFEEVLPPKFSRNDRKGQTSQFQDKYSTLKPSDLQNLTLSPPPGIRVHVQTTKCLTALYKQFPRCKPCISKCAGHICNFIRFLLSYEPYFVWNMPDNYGKDQTPAIQPAESVLVDDGDDDFQPTITGPLSAAYLSLNRRPKKSRAMVVDDEDDDFQPTSAVILRRKRGRPKASEKPLTPRAPIRAVVKDVPKGNGTSPLTQYTINDEERYDNPQYKNCLHHEALPKLSDHAAAMPNPFKVETSAAQTQYSSTVEEIALAPTLQHSTEVDEDTEMHDGSIDVMVHGNGAGLPSVCADDRTGFPSPVDSGFEMDKPVATRV